MDTEAAKCLLINDVNSELTIITDSLFIKNNDVVNEPADAHKHEQVSQSCVSANWIDEHSNVKNEIDDHGKKYNDSKDELASHPKSKYEKKISQFERESELKQEITTVMFLFYSCSIYFQVSVPVSAEKTDTSLLIKDRNELLGENYVQKQVICKEEDVYFQEIERSEGVDGETIFHIKLSPNTRSYFVYCEQRSEYLTDLGLWYDSAEILLKTQYYQRIAIDEKRDDVSESLLHNYLNEHLPSMFETHRGIVFINSDGTMSKNEKDLTVLVTPTTFHFKNSLIDRRNVTAGPQTFKPLDAILSNCHIRIEVKAKLSKNNVMKANTQLKGDAIPVSFCTDFSGMSGSISLGTGKILGKLLSCIVAFEPGNMCPKLVSGGEGANFSTVDRIIVVNHCQFVPHVIQHKRYWLPFPPSGDWLRGLDEHLSFHAPNTVIMSIPPSIKNENCC